jgi:Arc/MetJ family transcription regulator
LRGERFDIAFRPEEDRSQQHAPPAQRSRTAFGLYEAVAEALKSTSIDAYFDAGSPEAIMRTTVTLDDDLLADAEFYTGIREKSALLREALRALVQREAARRLARLGGSEPDLRPIPRRRAKAR